MKRVEKPENSIDKALCTLIWADLPSRLAPFEDNDEVPKWNEWNMENLSSALAIAGEFLSEKGFFVTTSSIQHQYNIVSYVLRHSQLEVIHCLFLETATQNKRLVFDDFEEVQRNYKKLITVFLL